MNKFFIVFNAFMLFSFFGYSASLVSVSPAVAIQGQTLTVTITGLNTHFDQASSTNLSQVSSNTVIYSYSSTKISDTSLQVTFIVPDVAPTGKYNLNLNTDIDGPLTLIDGFQINVNPTIRLLSVSQSIAMQGQTLDITITGANTHFNQVNSSISLRQSSSSTIINSGTITKISDTSIKASFTIPANASIGNYDVNLSNSLDGNLTISNKFQIKLNTALLSVSPASAIQGETLTVTITGLNTHFNQASGTINLSQASNTTIDSNSITKISDTSIQAQFSIPYNALTGKYDINLYTNTDGYLTLIDGFQINAKPVTVIQVSAPADIYSYVMAATDGDVIELTTSGGAYTWSAQAIITTEKALNIRAQSGLAIRPVITSSSTSTTSFLRYNSSSTASTTRKWSFDGIEIDAYNSTSAIYSSNFFYSYLTPTNYGINVDVKNCVFKNFGSRPFAYSGTGGSSTATVAQGGDINVTNCEFRSLRSGILSANSLYLSYNPNNVTFSNCLFMGPLALSTTTNMISMPKSGYNSYLIDHCTFANTYGAELNLASTISTSYIKNSIFTNNVNSNYNNVYTGMTLGADCGIYYTAGGTKSSIYPNSTSAKTTDPLLDGTSGIATATAYKTGSTDGMPIGYYGYQITTSASSLTGLNISGSTINPSAQQSFTVSANSLLNDVIVTPPTNYEISKTSGSGFVSSAITLTQTGGSVPSTTIYVRLKAGLADNTYTGNISLTSTGAASKTVAVSGTVTNAPTIYSSLASLSGFKYAIGGGPSAEQSITVNAVNLSTNLSITAPSNYEISPLSGASFTPISPISIAQTGGVVSSTTIYVRLKAGLAINSYAQNISLTAASATTKNIALTGNVNNLPAISNSVSSINGLYSFYDISQSTEQSFTVGGTDLTGDIIVTPPTNYEISTTAGANYTYSSTSITLPLVGGGVANTTIYVRIIPGTYLGTKSGNITIATAGVTTKNIALSGKVTNQPVISSPVTTVTGLNYFTNAGPSAEQSFTVSGTNLTDNVVVTPSTSFEISTANGASFVASPSIAFTPTNGTLTTKTVYVRLKAGLTANTYTEDINITASYATDKKVSVGGTITNKPTVTILPTSLSGFGYNLGNGPSPEKTFTVSGVYLGSVILITPTTNFEISTSTGASFAATNPILISQSGGTAAQTTIYVRLKAGLVANAYTGDIVVTSTGATTQNLACSGTILDPQNLTVQIGAGGIAKENNVTLSNGAVLVVNKGTTKTFVFTPDYGYEVNTLTLNNVDVKSQISNNSYTTSAINGVSTLSVTFKKMQYILSLKDASSGSIDLISDYGSTPSFKFTPTSNWIVSTVFYNNVDVTSSLVNGVYTVPAITANGLLNISFVNVATGAPQLVNGKIKVYTNQSDIIVEGTTLHEIVNIYSITGVQLQSIQSQGDRLVIPVQKDAAYLVKASNMTFKVIL